MAHIETLLMSVFLLNAFEIWLYEFLIRVISPNVKWMLTSEEANTEFNNKFGILAHVFKC